ncbi:MAG: LysR family transcriptional regulator [Rubellimicrobium sp.]|nr:LysR family transcriptional regulator [Rubellimicrobium sp.]
MTARLFLRLFFDGLVLGPGKVELLERIHETGSISAAGRAMGMSYRRAWSLVEEMNQALREPAVLSIRGGPGGGGALVTPTGTALVHHYRALMRLLEEEGAEEVAAITALLRDCGDMSDGK